MRKTVANTSGYIYTTYNYTWRGNQLAHMTNGSDVLHFFYDAQNRPAKVSYNGTIYTYIHNLQGDIVGILDSNGTVVVEYKYNAWGAQLSRTGELANTLGYANPFRYRGYIYDDETWMYWLRSRYYYPELHRFISADSTLNGIGPAANIYCYCNNNPTRFVDTNGCAGESVTPVPTIFPTPAPSRSLTWDEDFEQRVFFSAAGSYYYGEPNSYRAWQNSKGEWYERWYGDDGTPIMDRHWSDHGNAKRHPFVPHDEDWKDDGKGGKTLDSKSSRPSPEGVKNLRRRRQLLSSQLVGHQMV